MPKVIPPKLPVSGLFAVAKPSGPTSMAVVECIKKLVGGSRLFVNEEALAARAERGKRRGRKNREAVKVGQGGTLDPLADGVLGS
jgi:tRNA pseudouridine55 synthase